MAVESDIAGHALQQNEPPKNQNGKATDEREEINLDFWKATKQNLLRFRHYLC